MRASRRRFLREAAAAGFALTPLAAALSACAREALPDGLAEIKWDRDTCARCSMVISDRRFAAQVRGGPRQASWKFDDIGCVAFWLQAQPWGNEAATRIWVTDAASGDKVVWLDARQAHYVGGKSSPMGYDFAAYAAAAPRSLTFEDMRTQVLAKGK
jgi:nitrous oxide reductase accessory protein NosL